MKLRIQLRDKYAEQLVKMSELQGISPTQLIINLIKGAANTHERSSTKNTISS